MADQEQELQPQPAQAEMVQEEPSLLDEIIEKGRLARDESQKEWAKDVVGEFVKQIMAGTILVSKDTEAMINARIAQIDHPRTAPILVGFARDPAYAPVLEELLRILAGVPNGDEALIGALMHEHLAHDQPARRIAREYLLRLASRVHRPNES